MRVIFYYRRKGNGEAPYSVSDKAQDKMHMKIRRQIEEGTLKGKNPGDVWEISTQPFSGAHFAVFPPELVKRIIKAGCPKNGIILDPFCGSGTALWVARRLGRDWIGIDLSPKYVEMSWRRVKSNKYNPPPENVPKLKKFLEK